MKRSRESSSKAQEECERLTDEKVSSAKKRKVAVATCLNEKPRATKKVSVTTIKHLASLMCNNTLEVLRFTREFLPRRLA